MQMPFTNKRGLIACLSEYMRNSCFAGIKPCEIIFYPILMWMLSCKQSGSCGRAYRIANKSFIEFYSFFRQPVDIRSRNKFFIIEDINISFYIIELINFNKIKFN